MFTNLLMILIIAFGCFLFWRHRQQVEFARTTIEHKCRQLDLQLVSIAFQYRFRTRKNRWLFHKRYIFEFSSQGDDCYQGYLDMIDRSVMNFHLPAYRENLSVHANHDEPVYDAVFEETTEKPSNVIDMNSRRQKYKQRHSQH